jgi:hypothetical protein
MSEVRIDIYPNSRVMDLSVIQVAADRLRTLAHTTRKEGLTALLERRTDIDGLVRAIREARIYDSISTAMLKDQIVQSAKPSVISSSIKPAEGTNLAKIVRLLVEGRSATVGQLALEGEMNPNTVSSLLRRTMKRSPELFVVENLVRNRPGRPERIYRLRDKGVQNA